MTMEGESGLAPICGRWGVSSPPKANRTPHAVPLLDGRGSPVGIRTLVVVDAGAAQVYGVAIETCRSPMSLRRCTTTSVWRSAGQRADDPQ